MSPFHNSHRSLAIATIVMAWVLAGCASSELKVDLALYCGDPAYGLGPKNDTAVAVQRASTVLEKANLLSREATSRAETAERLYQMYEAVFVAQVAMRKNPPPDPRAAAAEELSELRQQKDAYVASLGPLRTQLPALTQKLEAAIKQVQAAADNVERHPNIAKAADDLQVKKSELAQRFTALQVFMSTLNLKAGEQYAATMNVMMPAFQMWILDLKRNKDAPAVRGAVGQAVAALASLPVAGGRATLSTLSTDIEALAATAKVAVDTWSNHTEQANAAVRETITASLFRSMQEFESLQDAADPAWRVVRDPRNEDKWIEQKAQTYFYSEGKNSVVVVRDRPDDFRVQNATNNPTALVRSQLEISRAVTNAAITIGGAALGAPKLAAKLPTQPSQPGTAPTTPETDNGATSERQAADAARIAEEARLRRLVVEDLRSKMRTIQSDFDGAGDDEAKLKVVADELYAVMAAAKTMLPSPPPETTAGTGAGGSGNGTGTATGSTTTSGGATSGGATTGGTSTGGTSSGGATSGGATTGSESSGTSSSAPGATTSTPTTSPGAGAPTGGTSTSSTTH
jgi:hypothetical protein